MPSIRTADVRAQVITTAKNDELSVAAAVVVALPAFTELTMSVLLQAPGTSTLGVVLFSLYEYGDPQEAMALAAVLVALALGGQVLILRLRGRSA